MKYFRVLAKCGHVGRQYYIPVDFAIVAEDGRQAATIVRQKARVKHDEKDAILSTEEISFEEFMQLRSKNDADPYLHCKNIQQQRGIENLYERLIPEKRKKQVKTRHIDYKMRKNKIIERDAKNIILEGYIDFNSIA